MLQKPGQAMAVLATGLIKFNQFLIKSASIEPVAAT